MLILRLKYFFLFVFLFCFSSQHGRGQNTIYRNNYFNLGNSYPYVFLDSMKKDTVLLTGNNVTWNFSNALQTSQIDTLYAIDPSTTIFYPNPNVNYDISNLCLYEPLGKSYQYDDSLYNYYISDSSSIYFVGNWAYNGLWENWYYHLADTEKYFAFPFSFNDNFQDSFIGTYYDMSGSGSHTVQGTRNVAADGFGTLILLSTIYSNCLRIKSVRNGSDSSMTGIFYFTQITYSWFQLMTNGPILEVQGDSNYIIQAKYYYNNPIINSTPELINENSIIVFPNPFTLSTIVKVKTNSLFSSYLFSLFDVFGKKIKQIRFSCSEITITKDNLPVGIYMYEIISDKKNLRSGSHLLGSGKIIIL